MFSINKLMLLLISLYKIIISPIISNWICCRFHPTCSEYASECFQKYAFNIALKKTFLRLTRCNPMNRDTCIDFP